MEENMVMDTVVTENPQGNEPDKAGWIKEMKKAAVKIGWKYFVFGVVVIIAQYIYAWLLPEKYYTESWANFLQIIIPTYCIAFPVLCLLVCKMPKVQIEKKKMGFWKIVLTVIIGSGICGTAGASFCRYDKERLLYRQGKRLLKEVLRPLFLQDHGKEVFKQEAVRSLRCLQNINARQTKIQNEQEGKES